MPDVWLGNGTIRTLAEAGARLFVSLVFFFVFFFLNIVISKTKTMLILA